VGNIFQPLIAAILAQSPGEAQAAWTNGPTPLGSRASAQVSIAQYIAWVAAVESGLPGHTPRQIIRRVRRMHYSRFSVKPDSSTSQSLDDLIGGTADNPDGDPPLTTAQDVLNGLYSTSAVVTESGSVVDITHALNIIDFAANGRSVYGGVANAGTFVVPGYATASADLVFASLGWLGDIGSIWLQWMTNRGSARTQPATLTGAERTNFENALAARCPLDDLLGDIDGAVMATMPGLLQRKLSATLTSYYSGEISPAALTAPTMNSRQRFHYFIVNSIPEFAHRAQIGIPLRTTVNASNADMIFDLLKDLASIIWHGFAELAEDDPATHDPIFREIANRFLKWLQDALADPNCGVPAWPPVPGALPS